MDAVSLTRVARAPRALHSLARCHRSAAPDARASVAVRAEEPGNLEDSLAALPEPLRERLRRRRQDGSAVRLWSLLLTPLSGVAQAAGSCNDCVILTGCTCTRWPHVALKGCSCGVELPC